MIVYKVTQKPSWACPGMLIFVIDNEVVGHQTDPLNDCTRVWYDMSILNKKIFFRPDDYESCQSINYSFS